MLFRAYIMNIAFVLMKVQEPISVLNFTNLKLQYRFCRDQLSKNHLAFLHLLSLFYRSFIESVVSFPIICWSGNMGTRENARDKIVKVANKIKGIQFNNLNHIFNKQVVKKAKSICSDGGHTLCSECKLLPSGVRPSVSKAKTNRYKNSFVPISIRALNAVARRK